MLGTDDTAAENAGTSLLYAGEQYDSKLDHYYLRARYYNPWSGSFNRTDPFAGSQSDPQSLHKYLYCHNNPVNAIDPTGMFSLGEMVQVSAIVGSLSGIIAGELVRIKGGTEQQIVEAQLTWFCIGFGITALLYGAIWFAHYLLVALYGASAGMGRLQYAADYGIQTYNNLREAIRGMGLHAHHIIEQRFAQIIGTRANDMLSVAVSPEEHQIFTNAWRAAIPYGTDYATITIDMLWSHAQLIYAGCPALLDAARIQLGM